MLNTDLLSAPLHAHHEAKHAADGQNTADVINPSDDLLVGQHVCGFGRILVEEGHEHQTEEIPDTDEDSIVSPVAGFGDELCIDHGRAESARKRQQFRAPARASKHNLRQDRQHHQANILATLDNRHHLCCTSQSDQFIQPSAESREDLSSYSQSSAIVDYRDARATYR